MVSNQNIFTNAQKSFSNKKIYFFFGTTAEFIKLAPVIGELKKRKIKFKIVITGQNKIHFDDLKDFIGPIKPDILINEKNDRSSAFYFIIWAIKTLFLGIYSLSQEFKGLNKKNSYFIIHGDTVSSLIGALIAYFYKLKLVHVECGEISRNFLEPFPEEICKNISMRLADIKFAQNNKAYQNIKNLPGIKINTFYNTLIESFWWAMKTKRKTLDKLKGNKYYILILHRQEHVIFRKNWSKKILNFIISNADNGLKCALFGHPLTVSIIKSLNLESKGMQKKIIKIDHLPYSDFMKLLYKAEFTATDSCTNQLEAYYAGTPCLVLRDLTEQMDGVGLNVVVCKSDPKIMESFLRNYKKYRKKAVKPAVKPSKIIVDYLLND